MILAAGRGTRMQPKPDDPPKPLIEIAGQSLLARMMDRLIAARVSRIIVNVHHKAEMIETALQAYQDRVELHISDEREALLETGGGVKNALPLIGDKPLSNRAWNNSGTSSVRAARQRTCSSSCVVVSSRTRRSGPAAACVSCRRLGRAPRPAL